MGAHWRWRNFLDDILFDNIQKIFRFLWVRAKPLHFYLEKVVFLEFFFTKILIYLGISTTILPFFLSQSTNQWILSCFWRLFSSHHDCIYLVIFIIFHFWCFFYQKVPMFSWFLWIFRSYLARHCSCVFEIFPKKDSLRETLIFHLFCKCFSIC